MSSIESPFLLMKQLESDIAPRFSHVDLTLLEQKQQKAIRELKHLMVDARLGIQDYELAETRQHQLRNAKDARDRLDRIQALVSSNIIEVFGAVDVAHIVARVEQISGRLE